MTTLRTFLGGLLAALGLVALSPAVAHACSCALASPQAYADGADVVFTGTLLEVVPPPQRAVLSSGDPATLRFHVTSVSKGHAAETTEVTTAVSDASCGLGDLPADRAYVVYATGSDRLRADLCGGTTRATPATLARAARLLGPPGVPADGAPTAGTSTREAPAPGTPSTAGSAPADGGPGALAWLVLAGGTLAAGAAYRVLRRRV